ncbi:MAG: hypothetical protein SFX19_07225 [Alphaproteobacteria bacterium]|nr:hypothetical protein [Alphaproteobacteria bacterium]
MKKLYLLSAVALLFASANVSAAPLTMPGANPVICVPPMVLDPMTMQCKNPVTNGCASPSQQTASTVCITSTVCMPPYQGTCVKGTLRGQCGTYVQCQQSAMLDGGGSCQSASEKSSCTVGGKPGTVIKTCNTCNGVTTCSTGTCVANPVSCTPTTSKKDCTVGNQKGAQVETCVCNPDGTKKCAIGACTVDSSCLEGQIKNDQGICVSQCKTGEVYNTQFKICAPSNCTVKGVQNGQPVCATPAPKECPQNVGLGAVVTVVSNSTLRVVLNYNGVSKTFTVSAGSVFAGNGTSNCGGMVSSYASSMVKDATNCTTKPSGMVKVSGAIYGQCTFGY